MILGMKPTVKATTRMATWLLCMVMAWLSVSPPHCDLCDRPDATILSSSHPVINDPAPVERMPVTVSVRAADFTGSRILIQFSVSFIP